VTASPFSDSRLGTRDDGVITVDEKALVWTFNEDSPLTAKLRGKCVVFHGSFHGVLRINATRSSADRVVAHWQRYVITHCNRHAQRSLKETVVPDKALLPSLLLSTFFERTATALREHCEAESARALLMSKDMDKTKAQAVVLKALQIARLMDEICELAADSEINQLICEAYPFSGSLDEVSCQVIAWRDEMAKKAEVPLC